MIDWKYLYILKNEREGGYYVRGRFKADDYPTMVIAIAESLAKNGLVKNPDVRVFVADRNDHGSVRQVEKSSNELSGWQEQTFLSNSCPAVRLHQVDKDTHTLVIPEPADWSERKDDVIASLGDCLQAWDVTPGLCDAILRLDSHIQRNLRLVSAGELLAKQVNINS